MFGGLRKRLEEVVAQVNPFDGGKTAATVRAARQSAPPVQTVRQPANQPPSYGGGIGGFVNRTRDVFDDNTPQDQWKRQQWKAPLAAPKPVDARGILSRVYDQANIFDNNRTFKQADPTQDKSAFQQAGQFGGQVVRGTIGGTARMANTLAAQAVQVEATKRMLMAQATGNTEAYRNANELAKAADENFKRNEGGLLNTGTLYDTEEARRGDLKTGATRIGGGVAESGLEVGSLGLGGFTGKQVVKQGLKQGVKSQLPVIAKNAVLNTAQGGVMAANQGAKGGDIAKAAALGGVLGTAGDVGLGLAGAGIAKAATKIPTTNLAPTVKSNLTKLATDEGGFIQPGRTPKRIHPEDQNVMADFIDMQRGVYKPDPETAYNLELDASRIAERYGLPMPNTAPKLANVFDKRLQEEGYGKLAPPDGEVEQRLMLDYMKNPNRPAPSTSLVGDGAQAPLHMSPSRRQQLMANMRKIASDEQGGIPFRPDEPQKPQGFILKETRGRGGRKDTVRVKKGDNGLEATQQSEPTIQAKQYSEAFDVPIEQAQKDMLNLENADPTAGTRATLDRVKNSGKENVVQDMIDQKQYGVKDIQATPENKIDDVINKYLDIDELTDADMKASRPKSELVGDFTAAREKIRKTNVPRMINDALGRGIERTSRGGRVGRKFTRVLQYINKNAGQDPAMIKAAQKYAGESTFADSGLLQVGKRAYDLLPDDSTRAKVHAVLDPEGSGGGVKFDDLADNEKQAVSILRDLGDAINDTSYRTGFISKKKWESNRGGRYIARLYNEVATADDVADLLEIQDKRGLFLGMYKSRTEMNDQLRQRLIRDPVKLAVIRARQVRQNEALLQYMNTAESRGYVSATPKDGFIKVTPQNRMANWSGKYVRQDVFENVEGFRAMGKGMNAMNNLLDVYDGNPARRLRKKMLTIYNPVVRTGNVTSNYFFAYLNGVNPITFQKNKLWAKKALDGNDSLAVAAQKSGLIGNDIIRSDKNIFNKDKAFLTDLERNSQTLGGKIKGLPKTVDDKLSKRYANADDIAKLSALKSHVDRGIPVERAIEMTRRGFQDYSRVGHAYDMAAKFPVFGNAFVRFQGDLYTNILKNAAVDHPARLGAMVAGIATLGNGLSNLSGESAEDKKTREDRAGAPKIPFTDISTEFQTPWGAVDVARFTPLYMRQDIDGNSFADNLSRLSPVNIPSNTSRTELIKKAASDPLIGPVISAIGDTDWRGKSVKDPDGYRDGKALFPDDPLSKGAEWRNRLQYGVRSYAPYPFNEVGDILAAANQDKKNEQAKDGGKYDPRNPNATFAGREGYNTSGSKKTVAQSAGRLFGVRAEKYGKEEAEKQRKDNEMFAFFDKTDTWKKTLDSTTRQQFEARHKGTQTRDGIKAEFESDPWYKYKNAGELLQNPKLFEAEKAYAKMQNKYDGRPIDPVFDLPKDQRNMVLAKKLKLPGSKDEGFNALYDQEWYQNFRQKQDQYYKAKSKYAKSKGWSDYESDNPYPEAKKDVQKAMDAYFSLPSGTGQRSAFIRNNPGVWAQITAQWDAQNAWTDREREKLGLPKIAREDKGGNFYSGSGRSYGRSGRSGGSRGGRGGRRTANFDYTKNLFDSGRGGSKATTASLRKILEEAMADFKTKA